ncbi:MAG: DUF3995 domain-containing protein [Deltaproteobacteria bacterium]
MAFGSVIALLVVLVLSALAALHVYWGLGGPWGLGGVTPEVAGKPALHTGPGACAAVAALLSCAAAIVGARGGLFATPLPPWFLSLSCWAVAAAFALRTIGDFRLFGLFRRVDSTAFARNDARLFTPLCLLLAVACARVALLDI